MSTVSLKRAAEMLPELLDQAAHGEEVIITRGDGASFRIVPIPEPRPLFGSAKGEIVMRVDFDGPVPGFEEYAP